MARTGHCRNHPKCERGSRFRNELAAILGQQRSDHCSRRGTMARSQTPNRIPLRRRQGCLRRSVRVLVCLVLGSSRARLDRRPIVRKHTRPPRQHRWRALVVLVAASVLSACNPETAGTESAVPSVPTTDSTPSLDRRQQTDVMSPLVISALAPAPMAVRGSDERFHVAYQMTVLNFSPRPRRHHLRRDPRTRRQCSRDSVAGTGRRANDDRRRLCSSGTR
jgi:hypothetical protein